MFLIAGFPSYILNKIAQSENRDWAFLSRVLQCSFVTCLFQSAWEVIRGNGLDLQRLQYGDDTQLYASFTGLIVFLVPGIWIRASRVKLNIDKT